MNTNTRQANDKCHKYVNLIFSERIREQRIVRRNIFSDTSVCFCVFYILHTLVKYEYTVHGILLLYELLLSLL